MDNAGKIRISGYMARGDVSRLRGIFSRLSFLPVYTEYFVYDDSIVFTGYSPHFKHKNLAGLELPFYSIEWRYSMKTFGDYSWKEFSHIELDGVRI